MLQHVGSLKLDFSKNNSSCFIESKITTNFEAKTEQKINYPPDFGGLPRAVEKVFDPKPILGVPELQNLNLEYSWSLLG